jgi:NTE family protein
MTIQHQSHPEAESPGQWNSNLSGLLVACLFLLVSLNGCAKTQIENQPLSKFEQGKGYAAKFTNIQNGTKLKVVLAFSGGGTRAAALAYGVLKELRETEVVIGGSKLRLLDQVTTISSVSGGSFTAAYYGLHGEGIFDDFEKRFLRRDVDAELAINLFLRPIKTMRVAFTAYSRSDMAIDLYDKEIFHGATFADLEAAGGPMLNINATDIGEGNVFTFMQPVFDMICSDLSKMRVAQAVTASSAVPGIFQPLLLENHAGSCGRPEPAWISEALANPNASRRRYHSAREAATYLDREERPYIFLLDGGVADNIGARRIMSDVIDSGGAWDLLESEALQAPEHVVYVIVNAQATGNTDWMKNRALPSLGAVINSVSGTGIYRYNFETIELLRESVIQWSHKAATHGMTVNPYVVEVAFENVTDPDEKKYFNGVRTSLSLSDDAVDRLIEVGGRLLRDSPDFKRFLEQAK